MSNEVRTIRVLHVFSAMDRGGAELRTVELMRSLLGEPFEFHFCVLSDKVGDLDVEIEKLGGTIHHCPVGVQMYSCFEGIIKVVNPDVVHAHVFYLSGLFLRAAAKKRVPIRIVHFRSTHDGRTPNWGRKFKQYFLIRWLDKYATKVIGVSEGALESTWLNKFPDDPRAEVIYNGFPFPNISFSLSNEIKIKTSDSSVKIIHVGRFIPAKNHGKLVSVFQEIKQRLPNSELTIVGAGLDKLREEAVYDVSSRRLEQSVHFLGLRKDVNELLAGADLLLFPSTREGLPGVVIESMLVGTPVLASTLPGTREIKKYFPGMCHLLSVDEPDENWAVKALKIVQSPPPSFNEVRERYVESPFAMQYSKSRLTEIWRS